MTIGEYVRATRESNRLGQADLAKWLDVSVNFVSLIERGVASIPRDKLVLLIELLKLDTHKIVRIMVKEYKHDLIQDLL